MKFDHTDKKVRFAGLTRNSDVEMNNPVMEMYNLDSQPKHSLSQAIQGLPPVELAQLYVENPYTEEVVPIEQSNATINSDIAIEMAKEVQQSGEVPEGEGDRMTYATHSSGYAAVPHYDFFFPMATSLQKAGIENVAGEFRIYDEGRQVHGDIMFQEPGLQLNLDGDREPLYVGIQVGNSYDGTAAMYACGYAQDTWCKNSMRNLTDKKSRKHIGDPDEVAEWWDGILVEMTALRDILGECIEQALEIEIDFLDQPYDVEEFYDLLGLPGYISRAAATSARNRSPREGGTRTILNFWTLHSGLTSALTHDFNGSSETGSLETYNQIARDMLWNPSRVVADAKQSWQRQKEDDGSDSESTVSRELASIEQYEMTLDDRKSEFERYEEKMAGLLQS